MWNKIHAWLQCTRSQTLIEMILNVTFPSCSHFQFFFWGVSHESQLWHYSGSILPPLHQPDDAAVATFVKSLAAKTRGWRALPFLFYLYFNTSRTFWVIDLPKRSEITCKCLCVSAQIALWPRTLPTARPECAPATAASQRWRDKTTSSSRSNRAPRTWSWCTPTGPQR